MALVFHRKGEPAGNRNLGLAGYATSYWAENGWHDSQTGELVDAPMIKNLSFDKETEIQGYQCSTGDEDYIVVSRDVKGGVLLRSIRRDDEGYPEMQMMFLKPEDQGLLIGQLSKITLLDVIVAD